MLDSIIRENKKYHLQKPLEECEYEIKKNTMENLINHDFDSSSSDESENRSDSGPDSEHDSEPEEPSSKSESG